jgi:amino acid transporter
LEVYVLEDLSTIELESPLPTQPTLRYAMESHELAVQMGGIVSPTSTVENSHKEEQTCVNVELSTEVQEEIEAQDARREAKERISQILRGRPKRLERGVLRELWSFVVTDKE